MSQPQTALPSGFETLEPFVVSWAFDRAEARAGARRSSSAADRVAFFEAAKPLLAPALAYLDQKPLDQFDAKETRLMQLCLSFAHIAMAVEVLGDDEAKHAEDARHLTITRAPSEF
ncbi:hypothetical protein LJR219_003360 [Phenylobacterium sp. LjRoot219]|uniref:hypothetical protein n=1 Tax=Phenylobacterium sp. LjRoot219 TaxID=3342283 RepID=UPI003ECC72BF